MFGFNFDSMFGDAYESEIQIYVGDKMVQSDKLQAPSMIIESNYLNILQQIIQDKSKPLSVKLLVKKDIYDNDNFVRTIWNSVESSNYERKYDDNRTEN